MRRLKAATPLLKQAPPLVAQMAAAHAGRQPAQRWTPLRHLYGTARWQKLRWQVLVDALFMCARCKRIEADTSQLVADHIRPHRGDAALFWDRGNLQCLCKPCHDSAKQAEERAGGGW